MADKEYIYRTIEDFRYQMERGNVINPPFLQDFLNEIEDTIKELDKALEEAKSKMEFRTAQVYQQYGIIDALSSDCVAIFVVACDTRTIATIKPPEHEIFSMDSSWTYEEAISRFVKSNVYEDDKDAFLKGSNFDDICSALKRIPVFYHHFRVLRDGVMHYYYLKATKVESAGVLNAIMIGFICEDETKEKEILKSLSETDSMTKLYNHGTGEKKTRELLKNGKNGLFCILDIDKFKSINDTFGHAVGDEVIINVAHELKSVFKDDDIVFRLGGDEFAAFVPGILSRTVGMKLLRTFFRRINTLEIPSIQGRKIAISMGVVLTYGENVTFEEIYEKADSGVYISKKSDGNAITFYPDEKSILID